MLLSRCVLAGARSPLLSVAFHWLSSLVVFVVKEPWKISETADAFVSGDGRASPMVRYRGIIAPIVVQVCDGGTGKM